MLGLKKSTNKKASNYSLKVTGWQGRSCHALAHLLYQQEELSSDSYIRKLGTLMHALLTSVLSDEARWSLRAYWLPRQAKMAYLKE